MDQKAILGMLAVIFLVSILFFPQGGAKGLGWVLSLGIVFGALWFFKN
jgi:hypothetical protein